MIETAMRYEIKQRIPDISNQIYPVNAPKKSDKTYLVYARITTSRVKTLNGYTNKQELSYMYSIMSPKYDEMTSIRNKLEGWLLSLPKTSIGEDGNTYIEDLTINNIDETWESELGVNRGIIDFTIYI